MSSLTQAELAILGLIVEQPRYGYEIEQVIEERGMRDWTEVAFSSIYYILKKLQKKELIRSRLASGEGKGPARRVFKITQPGMQAWQAATMAALSMPVRGSDPFLLGLAGLPSVSPDESFKALLQYKDETIRRREHVSQRWQAAGGRLPIFLEGMFEFSVAMLDARIAWIDSFIARLEIKDGVQLAMF